MDNKELGTAPVENESCAGNDVENLEDQQRQEPGDAGVRIPDDNAAMGMPCSPEVIPIRRPKNPADPTPAEREAHWKCPRARQMPHHTRATLHSLSATPL